MKSYEVSIEDINPCGGVAHAKKELIEVEIESPDAYVKANGRYPVIEKYTNSEGDIVIVTGNSSGYILRYTFFE